MILVLSGRTASGKSTIAARAAEVGATAHASFGDYVRHLAGVREKDDKARPRLQELGQSRVDADTPAFVSGFLEFAAYDPRRLLVVDGLRHESVLVALKEQVGAAGGKLVVAYVDVSDSRRLERLRDRGLTPSEIAMIEEHPSERDVLHSLRGRADVVLDGEGDPEREAARLLAAAR